jgi:hypothetical protein
MEDWSSRAEDEPKIGTCLGRGHHLMILGEDEIWRSCGGVEVTN